MVPLHLSFVSSNAVLNDGETENHLRLRLRSIENGASSSKILTTKDSKFIVSFDLDTDGTKDYALASQRNAGNVKINLIPLSQSDWQKENSNTAHPHEWWIFPDSTSSKFARIDPNEKDQFAPLDDVEFEITGIQTSNPTGFTNLYLKYENIGNYPDGYLIITIEKTPLLLGQKPPTSSTNSQLDYSKRVGIGTARPSARLEVYGKDGEGTFAASFNGQNQTSGINISNIKSKGQAITFDAQGQGSGIQIKNIRSEAQAIRCEGATTKPLAFLHNTEIADAKGVTAIGVTLSVHRLGTDSVAKKFETQPLKTALHATSGDGYAAIFESEHGGGININSVGNNSSALVLTQNIETSQPSVDLKNKGTGPTLSVYKAASDSTEENTETSTKESKENTENSIKGSTKPVNPALLVKSDATGYAAHFQSTSGGGIKIDGISGKHALYINANKPKPSDDKSPLSNATVYLANNGTGNTLEVYQNSNSQNFAAKFSSPHANGISVGSITGAKSAIYSYENKTTQPTAFLQNNAKGTTLSIHKGDPSTAWKNATKQQSDLALYVTSDSTGYAAQFENSKGRGLRIKNISDDNDALCIRDNTTNISTVYLQNSGRGHTLEVDQWSKEEDAGTALYVYSRSSKCAAIFHSENGTGIGIDAVTGENSALSSTDNKTTHPTVYLQNNAKGETIHVENNHCENNYWSPALAVYGKAWINNNGGWSRGSDLRLKKNVNSLSNTLDKLLELRGVSFDWKKPERHGNQNGSQIGMIAQEVEKVFPEWVSENPEGIKELTISGFEALVIEALRELNNKIDTPQKNHLSSQIGTTSEKPLDYRFLSILLVCCFTIGVIVWRAFIFHV